MNIIFFGTPELSAYVLEKLHSNGFAIKAVVTQPDRKSGRGLHIVPPPVKELATELGLGVFQSERFDKKLFSELKGLGAVDLCVVVAYGCYIPSYFIEHMNGKILNIHFSLLPKYRGAAPVARAIMNGDDVCGVTIMEIGKEMDAGDIVAQVKINIDIDDNTETLSLKLVKVGTELLMDTINNYLTGKVAVVPQSNINIEPTHASKIHAEEKIIDWNMNAVDIHNQVRALYPWPVAESKIDNTVVKFIKVNVVSEKADSSNFDVGAVVDVDQKNGFFTVKTGKGLLLVEKVKPSGKKEMSVTDFLNGYILKKGMRFTNV
jgi:methionyl-tRNA formyltransferase